MGKAAALALLLVPTTHRTTPTSIRIGRSCPSFRNLQADLSNFRHNTVRGNHENRSMLLVSHVENVDQR
jgi:hypothetical protein